MCFIHCLHWWIPIGDEIVLGVVSNDLFMMKCLLSGKSDCVSARADLARDCDQIGIGIGFTPNLNTGVTVTSTSVVTLSIQTAKW